MSTEDARWDALDPQASQLRSLVASVDGEFTRLASTGAGDAALAPLQGAWLALVRGLALGPEPELRRCPFCTRGIMHSASRCRYCLKNSDAAPAASP